MKKGDIVYRFEIIENKFEVERVEVTEANKENFWLGKVEFVCFTFKRLGFEYNQEYDCAIYNFESMKEAVLNESYNIVRDIENYKLSNETKKEIIKIIHRELNRER